MFYPDFPGRRVKWEDFSNVDESKSDSLVGPEFPDGEWRGRQSPFAAVPVATAGEAVVALIADDDAAVVAHIEDGLPSEQANRPSRFRKPDQKKK